MKNTFLLCLLTAVATTSCDKENSAPAENPTIIQSSGDITNAITGFRNLLGTLNTAPGATSGRREINWDGVPDSLEGKALPLDFFNPVGENADALLQRGLTYDPAKGTFMVSGNSFAQINNEAASQFSTFSGAKTFANVSVAQWPVGFQKAGTTVSASVQGFGAVFSDVDEANTTSLEFFDDEKSLGKYFVPPHDNSSSLSFLGVYFKNDQHITKVQVTHDGFLKEGTKDISDGGTRDLVVLDDFIYSEPLATE
jgi:hypothetical protein